MFQRALRFAPLVALAACSAEGPSSGDGGASGGQPSSVGGTMAGGTSATGGVSASGGASTGGVSAAGGTQSGGAPSGGMASGGAIGAGGSAATGGSAVTTGGAISTDSGGGASTGGSPAVGGQSGQGCPFSGNISYTLAQTPNPSADEAEAYGLITEAVDHALEIYNCYTDIEKQLNIQYVPSVATADGNPNGSIRFGSRASMNFVTAMHEISHTLGVGADGAFDPLIVGGVYQGPIATAKLRELTGDETAEIHGDSQHFWPYGLNYETEYESEEDGIFHCYIVTAIRQDIGWD